MSQRNTSDKITGNFTEKQRGGDAINRDEKRLQLGKTYIGRGDADIVQIFLCLWGEIRPVAIPHDSNARQVCFPPKPSFPQQSTFDEYKLRKLKQLRPSPTPDGVWHFHIGEPFHIIFDAETKSDATKSTVIGPHVGFIKPDDGAIIETASLILQIFNGF